MHTLKGVFILSALFVLISGVVPNHAAPASSLDRQTLARRNSYTKEELLGPPGQGRHPAWILNHYGDDAYLKQADKEVFNKNLRDVEISHQLSHVGENNEGIYTLKKDYTVGGRRYPKDSIVMKVLLAIDNTAWGEVRALKDVGQYIDSGLAIIRGYEQPVVLIRRFKGVLMDDAVEYQRASQSDRARRLKEAKRLVRSQVIQWVTRKRLLHADFNIDNFIVGGRQDGEIEHMEVPITRAYVIDLGHPGIFKVARGVTEAQVKEWFELQWDWLHNQQEMGMYY